MTFTDDNDVGTTADGIYSVAKTVSASVGQ